MRPIYFINRKNDLARVLFYHTVTWRKHASHISRSNIQKIPWLNPWLNQKITIGDYAQKYDYLEAGQVGGSAK